MKVFGAAGCVTSNKRLNFGYDPVVGLVLSRLDYSNATLVGLAANLLHCPQSVLNAAARSVAGLRRSDHITDTLASFHWLRVPERIKFKLAVIVYRGIHGTAPRYLSDLLHRVSDITSIRRLRSSINHYSTQICSAP